ncbi:MAG: DUF4290 domain-containing protein [Ekhidna sp.]
MERSLEYNTQRSQLKLREYGRNVQNLVAHLKTIEDKEARDRKASTIVELMKLINPDLNADSIEYDQKIWDDLYIISGFEIDFNGPYDKPDASILNRKPERMKYYSNAIKFKHYGRGVEILIDQAIALEDPKEKEGAIVAIGRLMKSFFQTWNKEIIEDEQVLKNIKQLSKNQLDIDIELVKELGLFDSERRQSRGYRNHGKGGQRRNNNNNNQKGRGRNNQGKPNNNNNRRRHNN